MWQKLKNWCFHSVTVAWGYVKILAGTVLFTMHEVINMLGDIITNEEVKAALQAMNFPAYVGLALAVIGCITIAARLRTVQHATNENNEIIEISK